MSDQSDIDKLLATVERIGVVGSPSTTGDLSLEILGAAVGRKLVGELALLPFPQDGVPHYALGQITEVKLRNLWHEDATMRSLIRQRGRVDAVTERQDTHQGEMTVSAVFARGSKRYEPSILGTVPSTGTNIHLVNDALLDELLAPYKSQLFYLGTVGCRRCRGGIPHRNFWQDWIGKVSLGKNDSHGVRPLSKNGALSDRPTRRVRERRYGSD